MSLGKIINVSTIDLLVRFLNVLTGKLFTLIYTLDNSCIILIKNSFML